MVNETFARTVWPGRDPFAQCVTFNDPDRKRADGTIEPGPCRRIVGIFKDVIRMSLDEPKSLQIAMPAMRETYIKALVVRAAANTDPASLIARSVRRWAGCRRREVRGRADLRRALRHADRAVADGIDDVHGVRRAGADGRGGRLYSLLAFAVAQRRRELGIRAALGAKRRDLIGLVMHQAARFVGSGLLFGTLAALAASRYMDGLLFGVKAGDVTVYAAVMLTLIACGTLAALLPRGAPRRCSRRRDGDGVANLATPTASWYRRSARAACRSPCRRRSSW